MLGRAALCFVQLGKEVVHGKKLWELVPDGYELGNL